MFAKQTIRIDCTDVDKLSGLLKKYVKNKSSSKYLVASEISSKTGKPHFQGWIIHSIKGGTDEEVKDQVAKAYNNFRTTITPHYKTDKGREYSFTGMDKPSSYIPYIIHNSVKESVPYIDLITNYTEEEYQELLKEYVWIERRPHKLKQEVKPKEDWYDTTLQYLEDNCVKNGKIIYHDLPVYFEHKKPKSVNFALMYDKLVGMGLRLEDKYNTESNTRFRDEYFSKMYKFGEKIFY